MAKTSLTKDGQGYKVGEYVALNNTWGKGNLINGVDFKQSITFETLNKNGSLAFDGGVTFNWSWPTGGPYGVISYPEIGWGDSPLYNGAEETRDYVSKISDLKSFDVDLDIDIRAGSSYLNVAFDLWLTNVPLGNASTITTEVMIWLDSTKAPWGQKIATIGSGDDVASVYFVNDVKSGARVWDYVAVVYEKPHLSGTIDIKNIMDALAAKQILNSNDYVSGYHIGAELQGGAGGMTINELTTTFEKNSPTKPDTGVTLAGTAANDVLVGKASNDVINGLSGNDIIEGREGADKLDGGVGIDTVEYRASTAGVTIDLNANTAAGGHASGDQISNFENVTGSAYNDILFGTAGANTILGLAGNDSIYGRDGNDIIEGGSGADKLDGGLGVDTLEYRLSSAGVTIDLANRTAAGGDAERDTIINFENVTGSNYNDTLYGDAKANTLLGLDGVDRLDGRAGDDTIDGGAGNDVLTGGDGNDLIWGGAGWDRFIGGQGADHMYGGKGGDWFVYRNGDSTLNQMDKIYDFNFSEGDRLDFFGFKANTTIKGYQKISFIGTEEFSGNAGEVRYEKTANGTFVYADTNGDKISDLAISFDKPLDIKESFFVF